MTHGYKGRLVVKLLLYRYQMGYKPGNGAEDRLPGQAKGWSNLTGQTHAMIRGHKTSPVRLGVKFSCERVSGDHCRVW